MKQLRPTQCCRLARRARLVRGCAREADDKSYRVHQILAPRISLNLRLVSILYKKEMKCFVFVYFISIPCCSKPLSKQKVVDLLRTIFICVIRLAGGSGSVYNIWLARRSNSCFVNVSPLKLVLSPEFEAFTKTNMLLKANRFEK